MNRDMVCIRCPLGCRLKVSVEDSGVQVTGNRCPKGLIYAKEEVTAPQRILTSSVKVLGGEIPLVSVKTSGPLPKHLILEAQDLLRHLQVEAPVGLGQTVVPNLFAQGVDVVATRTVRVSESPAEGVPSPGKSVILPGTGKSETPEPV